MPMRRRVFKGNNRALSLPHAAVEEGAGAPVSRVAVRPPLFPKRLSIPHPQTVRTEKQ